MYAEAIKIVIRPIIFNGSGFFSSEFSVQGAAQDTI
jgi:hypothetical protein